MSRLGCEVAEHDAKIARRKQQPYLQPLRGLFYDCFVFVNSLFVSNPSEDLLSRMKFVIDDVADTHHQIHWDNYLQLVQRVEDFTSGCQLTSPQEYSFSRNRTVGFVKKCLINVKPIDNIESTVDATLRMYRDSQLIAGAPFRE
jgi:hypothetical protein